MNTIRIAIGQINCTVGALQENCLKIVEYTEKAKKSGADAVAFPELAITGYPPEDLLLKPKFIRDNLDALRHLSRSINGITAIIGFVDRKDGAIYNAASVIHNGRIVGIHHKMLLPNYGVFDEKRYFSAGSQPLVCKVGDLRFGVNICEDIWHDVGPTGFQVSQGAQLILNINASPYHAGKTGLREEIIRRQAKDKHVPVVYANLVGGQDELVFDGQSMIVDETGEVIARAEAFKEDLLVVDVPRTDVVGNRKSDIGNRKSIHLDPAAEAYEALKLGLYDYVRKNGFQKVVIGLSGGVDSSIVAAIATDALGKENVLGVSMPSPYTSDASKEDATGLAKNLGIRLLEIPIDDIYASYLATLNPFFAGMKGDITEENIQARIRGNVLMAFSNKFGCLVLTTGNKSEMSVGYATLYGDMAGGLAVIKDVPKTLVYRLAAYRNTLDPVIPKRVLTKAPTAELKPDQKDSDTLPPYEVLDPVLKDYVEEDRHAGEIISSTVEKELVDKVLRMVDTSEYKRRQSPPGIKITPKSFGRDRRMPITNRYRG